MKRPQVTQEIISEAAKLTAEECGNIDNKADLAEAIAACYSGFMDGFEIAKVLDNDGWQVDTMLVEDLDCMSHHVNEVYEEACKKWAEENDIQPPLPVGTIIKEGQITGIYAYQAAKYEVKPIGQVDEECGNRRLIIKFEDAIAA